MPVLRIPRNEVITLVAAAAPQTITASYVDLGVADSNVIDVRDITKLVLWINLDINQGTNVTIKMLGGLTSAMATGYSHTIVGTPVAGVSPVDYATWEINNDSDQTIAIPVELNGAYPYVKYQIITTDGGTNPIILSAFITGGK